MEKLKIATNQNGESQNGAMPKRRQTLNDVTARASSRILYSGRFTPYSHLLLMTKDTVIPSVEHTVLCGLSNDTNTGNLK